MKELYNDTADAQTDTDATELLEATFTDAEVAADAEWKQWQILTGELALRDSIQPAIEFRTYNV